MKTPVNVDIQASAKAEFSLKGEIPKKTVGRIFESLADVFSPFTESRGLRGDQIRLQREDIAIEIAKRAKKRLTLEGKDPNPVDNKILLPLIEKGSLENPFEDEMLERWSTLLSNAATSSIVQPRFVQILGEITPSQATLLDRIATNDRSDFTSIRLEYTPDVFSENNIRTQINNNLKSRKTPNNYETTLNDILDILSYFGCLVLTVSIKTIDDYFLRTKGHFYIERYDNMILDLEILASLGLLKGVEMHIKTESEENVNITYYYMTDLGVSFFRSVDRRDNRPQAT